MSAWPVLGAAVVACTLFAGSVAAKDVTVAIQVSTQGLDLNQPADARELYRRLQKAANAATEAEWVCGPFPTLRAATKRRLVTLSGRPTDRS
jgi:UrcA family protein